MNIQAVSYPYCCDYGSSDIDMWQIWSLLAGSGITGLYIAVFLIFKEPSY